jgi:hypothetical protein
MAIESEFEFSDLVEKIGEGSRPSIKFFELRGVTLDIFLNGLGFGKGGFNFLIK